MWNNLTIGPYHRQPAVFKPYDARHAQIAKKMIATLKTRLPGVAVEHIGSTAIPGCGGKGVVDLMIVCPESKLESIRREVDSLGFQRQKVCDPFPESRPMRTGAVLLNGEEYQIHVHIIPGGSTEPEKLLFFRNTLRQNTSLVAAYEKKKREIIRSGVIDSCLYSLRKGDWVEHILAMKKA